MKRRCSGCGWVGTAVHDFEVRRVRDLPIFDVSVELELPRLRLQCPNCGPKLEDLNWLEPYARITSRLARSVALLCKVMTLRHVAKFYGLAWSTVKLIDHRQLEREVGPPCLDGVTVIAMDEFAIQKGHRYATVIVEPSPKPQHRRSTPVGISLRCIPSSAPSGPKKRFITDFRETKGKAADGHHC